MNTTWSPGRACVFSAVINASASGTVRASPRMAATILPDSHWVVQLAYYAFAGLAWIVPPGFIIPWMGEGRNED